MPVQSATCPRCGAGLPADAGAVPVCPACGVVVPPAAEQVVDPTVTDLRGGPADSSTFGGRPAADTPEPVGLRPPERPDELGRLGPYRVLDRLGAGGMGAVYRAEDPHLRRLVALKVMLPRYAASPTARERFLREARAAAAVEHDHVVPIFQVGEDNGTPFLAMPLLRGESLADRLKREKPLSVVESLRIGREIALGLAAAHEKGLIHRDVKPANVWLEGEARRVKLLDFGLARSVAADTGDEHLTDAGAIVGTPAFMSPEQARRRDLDGRSDLFSLGAVLYQALSGRLPFPGPDAMSVLTALAVDTPPEPRAVNPAVPADVSAFVMRLLSKDPAGRPTTAAEAARRLSELLVAATVVPLAGLPADTAAVPDVWSDLDADGPAEAAVLSATAVEPEPARPISTPRKAPANRPRWPAVLGLAFALLVLVGGGVGILVGLRGSKTPVDDKPTDPPTQPVVNTGGPKPKAKADPVGERKAAELLHPYCRLLLLPPNGTPQVADPQDPLPAGPFEVQEAHLWGETPPPADFKTAVLLPALTGLKALQVFGDTNKAVWWADADFARLADAPCRLTLVNFASGLELTPVVAELLNQFPVLAQVSLLAGQADDAALLKLGGPALHTLTVHDLGRSGKVTEAGWAALAAKARLGLHLFRPNGVDAAACKGVASRPGLESLTVSGADLDEAALRELAACPKLASLNLTGSSVPDAGLVPLAGLKTLRTLDLTGTPVGDAGARHLAGAKSLRTLNLSSTRVSKGGVETLSAALPRCRIQFGDRVLEPADRDWAAADWLLGAGNYTVVVGLPDGKEVTVRKPADLPDGPFALLEIYQQAGGFAFTDEHVKRLDGLAKLRALSVPNNTISDAGVARLADRAGVLEELSLSAVTDEGMKTVGRCRQLKTLVLGPKVTDAGLAHLANLDRLAVLGLAGPGVTDAGIKYLAGLSRLRDLTLIWCPVGDAGVAHLLGLKALVAVNLAGTRVTAAGATALARARPPLTYLNLQATDVSDQAVADLAGLKDLQDLDVRGTRLTEAGHKKLVAALPNCKVHWEEPNRAAAERLLAEPGAYSLVVGLPDGRKIDVQKREDLPNTPFALLGVTQKNKDAFVITDEHVRRLARLPKLQVLSVPNNTISDVGVSHLLERKDTLGWVHLSDVTDEGMKAIGQLSYLEVLHLGPKVTDAGLAHLAKLDRLRVVLTFGPGITDTGLTHLAGLKLTQLHLKGTKVTEAGVKKLAAAIPGCTVVWDGGVIEPKK